jgi:hypothetical protein
MTRDLLSIVLGNQCCKCFIPLALWSEKQKQKDQQKMKRKSRITHVLSNKATQSIGGVRFCGNTGNGIDIGDVDLIDNKTRREIIQEQEECNGTNLPELNQNHWQLRCGWSKS